MNDDDFDGMLVARITAFAALQMTLSSLILSSLIPKNDKAAKKRI